MRRLPAVAGLLVACASGPPAPAALDTRNDACRSCRMIVSDARLAAQLVAPAEEPWFFDDIGCLTRYAADAGAWPAHSVAYVADHRTGAWVRAETALYTKVASLETPMGSHLIAHADAASRDADPAARGGVPRTPVEVYGAGGVPGDRR